MKKNIVAGLTVVIVLSLVLAGCIAPAGQTTSGPIQMKDGLGRDVTLAAPAQKIVSLAPSVTEALFAIGAGKQVAGRDEFSDYPVEAKALPSVGGSMGKYNLEAIAALQPDLVLAAGINTPEQVQSIEALGLKVFYLANPTDLETTYTSLQDLATLTGRQKEAADLVTSLKARVKAVEDKLANVTELPLVFYELDATDPAKPWTAGPGTFLEQLITLAKGRNVGSSLGSAWAQISQEDLLVQNPNIIFLGDGAYGTTPESVAARPGWQDIDAVKNNRIYTLDDNTISRPGPRLVDGLETLAALMHPEAFK